MADKMRVESYGEAVATLMLTEQLLVRPDAAAQVTSRRITRPSEGISQDAGACRPSGSRIPEMLRTCINRFLR
jgi:hypothetical protein